MNAAGNTAAGERHLEGALARAIGDTGTASFPASFAAFLRQCAPFDNFIVLAYKDEQTPFEIYREYADPVVFHAMETEYLTAAYLLDPFYEAHLKGIAPGLYRLLDLAPDQFKRSSYYQVYYQKTTLIDEVAAVSRSATGFTVTACMGTDRTSGGFFSRRAMVNLKRYEPVIAALMDRHWGQLRPAGPAPASDGSSLLARLIDATERTRGVKLSRRQAEVALLILQGHSSASIGLSLGISPHTVKVFRKQLYAKCTVGSQAELFAMMMPLMAEASGQIQITR